MATFFDRLKSWIGGDSETTPAQDADFAVASAEETQTHGMTPEEEESYEAYMLEVEAEQARQEAEQFERDTWGPEQEQAAIDGYYDRLMRQAEAEDAERDREASLPSEQEVLDPRLAAHEESFHAEEARRAEAEDDDLRM